MPFAHCIDCGSSALIDPSGRCPEGHTVGAAGARVAAAIGSAIPHPDEPQPWVHQVQLATELVDAAPPEPRTVRPPPAPAAPEPARSGGPRADQAATDDLMRELHALGDLGGFADAPAPTAALPRPALHPAPAPAPALAPAPASAPAPVQLAPVPAAPAAAFEDTTEIVVPTARPLFAAPAVRADVPAPPSSPEEATDLSSLANLAAAVRTLDEREGAADPPAAVPTRSQAVPVATQHLAVPTTTGPAGAPATLPNAAPPRPLFPTSTSPTEPARPDVPTAPVTPAPGPAPAPVPTADPPATASPFDGSFTARGDHPRRADGRTAKKGLFRR